MLGTLVCAPPGGGAKEVKLIPPVLPERGGLDGKSGADGIDHLVLFVLLLLGDESFESPESVLSFAELVAVTAIVEVKLASKAATASGESVWEKESGGNGTEPGAGATKLG